MHHLALSPETELQVMTEVRCLHALRQETSPGAGWNGAVHGTSALPEHDVDESIAGFIGTGGLDQGFTSVLGEEGVGLTLSFIVY